MNPKLHIKTISKNHRGVFAKSKIKKGQIIEMCPVVIFPKSEQKTLDKTHLFNYYFYWGKNNTPAIALGFGSLYNHSYEPNAEYEESTKKMVMVFKAIKNILPGEEITTNYNGDPESQDKLWFKTR